MICTSVIIVGKNDNAESERKIVLALFWSYTQGLADYVAEAKDDSIQGFVCLNSKNYHP